MTKNEQKKEMPLAYVKSSGGNAVMYFLKDLKMVKTQPFSTLSWWLGAYSIVTTIIIIGLIK